ncbi:MAG: hypothetical protein P4L43_16495 [Syntrophobacteraceae bacterium]|nr:hypothetical protein [Syntrophobacteraceae bacterium]
MRTDSLLVFSISTVVSTFVALFDHWLAHNPKMAANCTWQFLDMLLHGMSRAARVEPSNITEHIIEGVVKVGEQAIEQSVGAARGKPTASDSVQEKDLPATPTFGAGGV